MNACTTHGWHLTGKTSSTLSQSSQYRKTSGLKDVTGFVTCVYESLWLLGCVLSVDENTNGVKITFLNLPDPTSFIYPAPPDILHIHHTAVLAQADPRSTVWHT
jgi:hypothetical protein